jgi:hypothetical protein
MSTRSTRVQFEEPLTTSAEALRALAKLEGTLNPEAATIAQRMRGELEQAEFALTNLTAPAFAMIDRFGGDIGAFAEYGFTAQGPVGMDPSQYKDAFENPKGYEEAWNHPDPFQWEQWRDAINKEFEKMDSKGVWKKIARSDMEPGRRCVKHKWVMEIKRSGRF